MIRSLLKKRIREDKVANIFTNSILISVEKGFKEVAGLINEAPEFVKSPQIKEDDLGKFMLIIISGNLKLLPIHFSTHEEQRLLSLIFEKFSESLSVSKHDFNELINSYTTFLSKVNHPSNNVLYGMSKSVFYKYELGQFQEEYFRNLNSPNPLFLKRLDEVLENFIWDWDHLKEKFHISFK